MSERTVIQRHQFADYLDTSSAKDGTAYALMGTDFTTLDEEPGAQTETKKYVNEKPSSTSVTDYQTVFPFESDLIADQKVVLVLYNVGRNHAVGSDAEFNYVRAELWSPVVGATSEYKARLFTVSVEVSDITGETDQAVSGNLNAVGDFTDGKFNTETKTFTAGDFVGKYDEDTSSSDSSSSSSTDSGSSTDTDDTE